MATSKKSTDIKQQTSWGRTKFAPIYNKDEDEWIHAKLEYNNFTREWDASIDGESTYFDNKKDAIDYLKGAGFEVDERELMNDGEKGEKYKFGAGGEISDLGFAYLADLWFAVQQRDTDDYEKLAKSLDEEGVSYRIQNEVSADATELRGRKALSISEVHDRIKKILVKKYATGGEIESQIKGLEAIINSDKPQFMKDKAKQKLAELKGGGSDSSKIKMYIPEIKRMTGTTEKAVTDFIEKHSLSEDDVYNFMQGLGQKKINHTNFTTAILGKEGNDYEKALLVAIKSGKDYVTPEQKEESEKDRHKELELFKKAKKELVGYGIVDNISGEIVASKKTLPELMEASKKLEHKKGFEDMGSLVYEIIKVDGKNVIGDKVKILKDETSKNKDGFIDFTKAHIFENKLVTYYFKSEFGLGISKIEGKLVNVGFDNYAQYKNVFYINLIPKGKRKALKFRQNYNPYAIVLGGVGHPNPDDSFETVSETKDMKVSKSKHLSFSENWIKEFNSKLNPYLEKHKEDVIADVRENRTEVEKSIKTSIVEDDNYFSLKGKAIDIFYMGVSEPETKTIVSAIVSPEKFSNREVTLKIKDGSVSIFPINKTNAFMNGEEVEIRGGKEVYSIRLNKSKTPDTSTPKPSHKKLIEKLKAKKSKVTPSNAPSVGHKRDEGRDKKLDAKPLGKRTSASGNIYYENRLNRADRNPKKKFEEGGEIFAKIHESESDNLQMSIEYKQRQIKRSYPEQDTYIEYKTDSKGKYALVRAKGKAKFATGGEIESLEKSLSLAERSYRKAIQSEQAGVISTTELNRAKNRLEKTRDKINEWYSSRPITKKATGGEITETKKGWGLDFLNW